MTRLNKISVSIIAVLTTLGLSSVVNAASKSPHSVGVQLSGGSAEYKDSKQDGDGVAQLYFHYNYAFSDIWSVEVGLNTAAEADKWKCTDSKDKFVCEKQNNKLFNLNADKLNYSNVVVAGKGQYALTKRNSLYGKLGVQFYDYDIKNDKTTLAEDDGLGLFAEAGWQYKWDNGLALNAGLQTMKMGDLKVSGSTIGLKYHF